MGNNCCCDRRTRLPDPQDAVLKRSARGSIRKSSKISNTKRKSKSPSKKRPPKAPSSKPVRKPSEHKISKSSEDTSSLSRSSSKNLILAPQKLSDLDNYSADDYSSEESESINSSSQGDLTLSLNQSNSDLPAGKSFSIHFSNLSDERYDLTVDEALYFSLQTVEIFTKYQQNLILKLFSAFSNDIPIDEEEEVLEGVITVDKHTDSYSTLEMHVLVTNYSLYVVTPENLLLDRRVKLTDITIMGLTKNYSSCIFHVDKSDVNGDLWLNAGNVAEVTKAVQVLYKLRTEHYIPFYSDATENALNRRFNNISLSFLQTFKTREMVAVTDLLCKEGSLGENVLYIKRTQRITDLEGTQEIVALLTEKALYALTQDYTVIDKTYVQYIVSVHAVEGNSKLVIRTESGESHIWHLPASFLEKLERAISQVRKNKLKVESITENRAETMLSSGMSAYFSSTKDPRSPSISSINSANVSRRGTITMLSPLTAALRRPSSYPTKL
jgi:hypothetical protein